MRTLYQMPLSPFSRKVSFFLREKNIDFEIRNEPVWEKREKFIKLNPAGKVPVFIDDDGIAISESNAICEFIEEKTPEPNLIGKDIYSKAEIRRIVGWFDDKFAKEVMSKLIYEKIFKNFSNLGAPDSQVIQDGVRNLRNHMQYICFLIEKRKWLAGDDFSFADITAASFISAIDYIGDIAWEDYQEAKTWYVRIKSRKSFKPILEEKIANFPPVEHYSNLDF
ncbi:MAG: glutathione S-transferase family protein [Pseudomonadota bacterium]|nr:glutathione S-transferase family protein [Pseudomonadota bacterium]